MFCAMLAGGGVRAAPGVMILPLERAFGWSLGTISSAVSINIILLGYRAAPDRSGPGDRSEAYDPGVYGAIGSRHGPVALYDRAVATLHYLGLDGRDRRRGRRRRYSGGNRKSLVRGEERLGNGVAQRRERSRQLVFPPLLALVAGRYGWQGVAVAVTLAIAAMVPVIAILLPESRRISGSRLTAQPPTEGDRRHLAIRSQSR